MRVLRVPPHAMCPFYSPAEGTGETPGTRHKEQGSRHQQYLGAPVVLLVLKYWCRADSDKSAEQKVQASHHQRFVGGPTTRLRTWQIQVPARRLQCVYLRFLRTPRPTWFALYVFFPSRLCRLGVSGPKKMLSWKALQILVSVLGPVQGILWSLAFSSSISDLARSLTHISAPSAFPTTRAAKFTMVPSAHLLLRFARNQHEFQHEPSGVRRLNFCVALVRN